MSPILIAAVALCLPASPTPEAARAEYRSKKALMARTADAQVELALWCESKGLMAERDSHLAQAVLRDPSHSIARGLLGQVQHQGRWQRPEAVAAELRTDADWIARRQAYEAKRRDTPYEPEAQWQLAKWCGQQGLDTEARAHLTAVVKLDPEHEAARRKLGYRRIDGRWLTPEQSADLKVETQAQRSADKYWDVEIAKHLKKYRDRDPAKRNPALDALAKIHAPRAVPTVWQRLIQPSDGDQAMGAQILGQIDSPASSRALASLAAFAADPDARRQAAETLRSRDPREYADLLIALIRDPIRFEVRGDGTPESPRKLLVEGQDKNFERIYLPPPVIHPGDVLDFDEQGRPLVRRLLIDTRSRAPKETTHYRDVLTYEADSSSPGFDSVWQQMAIQEAARSPRFGRNPPVLISEPAPTLTGTALRFNGVPTNRDWSLRVTANYSLQQLLKAQARTAETLKARLDHEVATLQSANEKITTANDRIVAILRDSTKVSLGNDREAWRKWWINQVGYAYIHPITTPKETVTETVTTELVSQMPVDYRVNVATYQQVSCFAAGTKVATITGPRDIETLLPGDRVMTLDLKSGSLRYQPILVTHHNPPSTTVRITTQDETIASSDFHRFWKPGAGWVMARDLKVGDRLRTATGIRTVQALSTGPKEPVFNLDVAADANFFVGEASLLVHDNTLPDHRAEPYDRLAGRP